MLCGRRSHSSPASGEGQCRLKNWPGLTASALGEASTTRCLYSPLTHSCETIGLKDSSAGMCGSDGAAGGLLPTTKGADAKGRWAKACSISEFLPDRRSYFSVACSLALLVPKSIFFPIFEHLSQIYPIMIPFSSTGGPAATASAGPRRRP